MACQSAYLLLEKHGHDVEEAKKLIKAKVEREERNKVFKEHEKQCEKNYFDS